MAESHDVSGNSNLNASLSNVNLDSHESVINGFLQFAQAKKTPVEDWYTIPGNFDQLLENFQALYPQIWEALPSHLHFEIYQDRELYLPMAPPSSEHETTTIQMVQLLLEKLQTLRLQPGTSLVVQSFITTVERRAVEAILLDINSRLCPDEQLACIYDSTSPIVIEVACSQRFYGDKGLKWKLEREIVDSLGNLKVGLGLKIFIEQEAWNPCLTLYRPCYQADPTGTGGTIEVKEIFEQMSLTGPNASQDLGLTLGDFISTRSCPAILARFPGLQYELNLPIPITFADVAAAIANAKARIDARDRTFIAVGQPTNAPSSIKKKFGNNRDPGSAW